MDIVRLLSHTSGNTTAIPNSQILEVVKKNVDQQARIEEVYLHPYYLQRSSISVSGSSNPYKVWYSTLSPYPSRVIGAIASANRKPIPMVEPQMIQNAIAMPNVNASSVFGSIQDGYIELFIGSSAVVTDVEVYYFRSPKTNTITTSNYSSEYVDIPDKCIWDVVQQSVAEMERYK